MFLVTCGVKMIVLRHGWGWQPPQTDSCIHIRHVKFVWAHWYAVHGHKVAALNSYTHTTWLRFWGSGSLVESKWYHYVMIECDSHLKLIPASTLYIYIQSFWAHWYAVHGHMAVESRSYTHTTRVRCWGSGSLVESKWWHYVLVEANSHLKLLPTSTLDT